MKMSLTFALAAMVVLSFPSSKAYDVNVFLAKTDSSIYSPLVCPRFEKPIKINVNIELIRFESFDDQKSEFSLEMFLYFSWFDERLKLNDSDSEISYSTNQLEVDQDELMRIWRPNIHFSNAKPFSKNLLNNKSDGLMKGVIEANGRVHVIKQTNLVGACKLNFKRYPIDIQHCSVLIESTSISERLLQLQWDNESQIQIPEDFKWGGFDMTGIQLRNTRTNYKVAGPFTRLEGVFTLHRKLGYFLVNIYLPSTLFVISSWASFWIDIPAAPARVALVLTTMLTHVTSTKSIHDKLPKLSYINSLDVWVIICTMFIFAAVVEYATANYFYHKPSRIRDKAIPTEKRNLNANDNDINLTISDSTTSIDNCDGKYGSRVRTVYRRVGKVWQKIRHQTIPPFQEDVVPRRVALAIDRRSRFVFPISFILFNVIYWIILMSN